MKGTNFGRSAVLSGLFGAILCTLLVTLRASADTQADSVNGTATPQGGPNTYEEIGWFYTAKSNFNFDGVQTRFSSVDNRTVMLDIATIDPRTQQATLVRAASFTPSTSFAGASFEPLPVQAGTTVFIALRNVSGLGYNVVGGVGGTSLPTTADTVGDGRFDVVIPNGTKPVLLLFEADGPQPVFSTLVYLKGDLVPDHGTLGIPNDAAFTTLGVPAIGHDETVAFRAKYASPTTKGAAGKGEGIFVNGKAVALQFGPAAPGAPTGATYKSLSDPVVDDAGHVAFTATLSGHGISGSVIVSDAPGGTFTVVAETGHAAAESPVGIDWTKFTVTVMPGGGRGPVFLATLAGPKLHGNQALFGVDSAGSVRRMLADGDSIAVGIATNKTVKGFAVLKALPGLAGAGRSYNDVGDVVSMVTFTDGTQSIVRSSTP